MAQGGFQGLAEGDDFLMHGIAGRRLAALFDRFLVAMNAVFLDLAGGDFGEAHIAEERHQVHAASASAGP